jgi:hypothetical protein
MVISTGAEDETERSVKNRFLDYTLWARGRKEKGCELYTQPNIECLIYFYSYSVLCLRSQVTRPAPILPSSKAPGAGIVDGGPGGSEPSINSN